MRAGCRRRMHLAVPRGPHANEEPIAEVRAVLARVRAESRSLDGVGDGSVGVGQRGVERDQGNVLGAFVPVPVGYAGWGDLDAARWYAEALSGDFEGERAGQDVEDLFAFVRVPSDRGTGLGWQDEHVDQAVAGSAVVPEERLHGQLATLSHRRE